MNHHAAPHPYEGLIPAAYTPFDREGGLDVQVIPKLAAHFRADGAPAVFVAGTSGECHSLTTAERRALTERWVEAAGAELDVIVHVGTNAQRDAIELARHAQAAGARAVACMAPSYFRPASVEDLVDFLAPIAAAADQLPFYFYDIPALTGVAHRMDRFLQVAGPRIGNLAGVKFTSADLMRLQTCLQQDGGRFSLLYGNDETLLTGLTLGCVGAVGSTYNYAAPLYQGVLAAFARGDLPTARTEQLKSVRLVEILLEHGVLRAGRAIMCATGVDCGAPRSPIRPVEEQEAQVIVEKLRASGLLDLIAPEIAPAAGVSL